MATPPTTPITTPSPMRYLSKLDQDSANLEIIKEGAELEVVTERPRSATLPGNLKLNYCIFEKDEVEEEKSPAEEAVERRAQAEERLYDQQQLGDHKFYSFTR